MEAVQTKEVTLQHRVGTHLWADALTKILPVQVLERFKGGIGLTSLAETKEVVKVKSLRVAKSDYKYRLKKSFEVMLLGVTMFGAEGSDTEVAIPSGINHSEDWSF